MSLLLTLVLCAQSTNVTFRCEARPVLRVLQEISAKHGLKLRSQGVVGDEIVVIAIKEVPLTDFKDRLASSVAGKWTQDGDTWVLVRDEAKDKQDAQEELARMAQNYAKAIENYTQPLGDSALLTIAMAEQRLKGLADLNERVKQGISSGTPVGVQPGGTPQERLVARTLRALSPSDLAALEPSSRTVFSTAPNRMQRRLPQNAIRALETFTSEYGIWLSIAERYKPNDDESLYVDFGYFGSLKAKPAKMLLIATKWGDAMSVSLELKVVDTRGTVVTSSAAGLDANSITIREVPDKQPGSGAKPIQFSKESLEVWALRPGAYVPSTLTSTSPALKAKLKNPETNDPLSFGPSECLLGLADAEGKNMIACVPDRLIDISYTGSSILPSQVRTLLGTPDALTFEDEEAWLRATPVWPHETRATRTSRSAIGQLVRELDRPGVGSLEPLARYATQVPGNSPSNLAVAYISMLHPEVAGSLDASSWELMRVYMTLPANQKHSEERVALNYRGLDSQAKAALTRLLFYSEISVAMGAFQTVAATEESGGEILPNDFESATSEPTEAFPNGLPDDAVLTIDRIDARVAVSPTGASFTPEDLGTQLAMRERPEIFPYVSESPLPPRYSLANRNSLLITLGLNQEPVASFMLSDFRRGDGQWLSIHELPKAFKDEVDKARLEAREAFKSMPAAGAGTGTGSNIPPL